MILVLECKCFKINEMLKKKMGLVQHLADQLHLMTYFLVRMALLNLEVILVKRKK